MSIIWKGDASCIIRRYLSGQHPLEPLEVVTFLVVILHLEPVDSVAVVQCPEDDLAHVVRPLLRIYYNSEV